MRVGIRRERMWLPPYKMREKGEVFLKIIVLKFETKAEVA
jgi:hypothetical protein